MGKKILAVYYTQSGQTKAILDSFLQPLLAAGHSVEFLKIETEHPFPFPWTTPVFFDTVPESVSIVPTPLKPWATQHQQYDIIILAWQPWNLSPSIPFNSILQDPAFKAILQNTPVVTLGGCRNMWISAQEQNKRLLQEARAQLVGHIVLFDRHPNHLSYFTIFHWLGTGRKDRKWGIFPKPGVSDKDIAGAAVFGATLNKHLNADSLSDLQPALVQQKAVVVKYSLMYIENKAIKIFKKWVALIQKHPQNRKKILVAYQYYLAIALLVASPIILFVDLIFFRPFLQRKIKARMDYYSSVDYKPQI